MARAYSNDLRERVARSVLSGRSARETATLFGDGSDPGARVERPRRELIWSGGHIRPLKDIERDVLRLALAKHGGSVKRAAKALGVSRKTFYRKLDKLAVRRSASRGGGDA